MAGTVYAGTSGFAYPAWAPRFYPSGLKGDALLRHYASRLTACELNNTYYQSPSAAKVEAWLAATPAGFRFAVKAQRGGSYRSLLVDPIASVPWLTEPLRRFEDRLGTVLFRVHDGVKRDDARLAAFLEVWPRDLPLTMEFQDPTWSVDEVFAALSERSVAICATEMPDDAEPPTLRRTGRFLYLRLRRHDYSPAELATWADRLEPFVADGLDAYVFFRHDDVGRGAELALEFAALTAAR
jgi:uncharacterized protein YecE (DUF72 family)